METEVGIQLLHFSEGLIHLCWWRKTWGAQAIKPGVSFPWFVDGNACEISEESLPWPARSSQAEFLFNLSSTNLLFNFFLKLLQNPFGLKMDVRAKPLNNAKDALNNLQSRLEEVRVLIHQEQHYLWYLLISTLWLIPTFPDLGMHWGKEYS